MATRRCRSCREKFDAKRDQRRCERCQRDRQREASAQRDYGGREPWRALYRMPEWKATRTAVMLRDSHQCRALEASGRRCTRTDNLQVHHLVPLRVSWDQTFEFAEFVEAACRERDLVTVCPAHHARAEAALRSADTE